MPNPVHRSWTSLCMSYVDRRAMQTGGKDSRYANRFGSLIWVRDDPVRGADPCMYSCIQWSVGNFLSASWQRSCRGGFWGSHCTLGSFFRTVTRSIPRAPIAIQVSQLAKGDKTGTCRNQHKYQDGSWYVGVSIAEIKDVEERTSTYRYWLQTHPFHYDAHIHRQCP